MDETDLRILRALQANPRIPVSKIARAVGLTDNAIRYRVRRMQAAGVIREFVTVVDPRMLGRPVFALVMGRLRSKEDLAAPFEQVPEVLGAYTGSGDCDCCLLVCARDEPDLERVLDGLKRRGTLEEPRVLRVEHGYRFSPVPLSPAPLGLEGFPPRGARAPPPPAEP